MDEELAHLAVDAAWQSLNLRASVRRGPRGGRVEIHFTTLGGTGTSWINCAPSACPGPTEPPGGILPSLSGD